MENLREIVLDALILLEKENITSSSLIYQLLDKYDYLEQRDKAFIKRLFEGTIEKRIELDYRIEQFSSVKVSKMKPFIRSLMRMSVYQIVYMTGTPDRAVVDEAVKLSRKRKFQNLSGFVNAVLRKIAADKEELLLPDEGKEPLRYLSVKYSMPEWLVELWLESYGREQTISILEAFGEVSPVSIRFSTRLTSPERERYVEDMKAKGLVVQPSSLLPYVYLVSGISGVSELPGYREGTFIVQDASSACAVEAAGIQDGDFVLDACAAPGGKSILASEKAYKVLSRDVSEEKTAKIIENAQRMNAENIEVQVHDARVLDEDLKGKVDVLLLDVPCSGLGIIGKKRDIKYRVTREGLAELKELQRQIVKTCCEYVKEGGTLLYSTCTMNPEENEKQIQWILENLPFTLEGEMHQLFPGKSDGFFYSKLVRK